MKYHPIFKALAIVLAAAALLVCVAGAFGVIWLASHDLYSDDLDTWMYNRQEMLAYEIADRVLVRYSDKTYGNCPELLLEYMGRSQTDESLSSFYMLNTTDWKYRIEDGEGNLVDGSSEAGFIEGMSRFRFEMSCEYLVLVHQQPVADTPEYTPESGEWVLLDPAQAPTDIPAATVDGGTVYVGTPYDNCNVYEINGQEYFYRYELAEHHTVTVWLTVGELGDLNRQWIQHLQWLYPRRVACLWICVGGLLAFALLMTYLGFAAGRSRKNDQIRAGGLNRIPLDLYLTAGAGLGILTAIGGAKLLSVSLGEDTAAGDLASGIMTAGVFALLLAAVIAVALLFAVIAQFKTPGRFWWRNSIIGRLCRLIGRLIRFVYRALRSLFRLLPLVWQWILTAVMMVVTPAFFFLLFWNNYGLGLILSLLCFFSAVLADIALVCYGAYAFGVLRKGAKAMSDGELTRKISTKYLFGCYRDFADHLNAISDAARVAAQNEMKSQRMKTELITNVSHDIKTPLTSIINYVDLLQKPHTEEQGVQYLEVLQRQSQGLKKLVDDLMEMSKASTGNMPVTPENLDMAETVKQALGEFADKLAGQNLQVIFHPPAEPVKIYADGRLTWRVLSNLLSNVVKYALPGTRVYVDLYRYHNHVLLSVKNISKESLNVSAQELTERFVRGDASRNTEGSGLGLNIAQSLMELQKGRLNLLVDGDLFKVTLTFPEAE